MERAYKNRVENHLTNSKPVWDVGKGHSTSRISETAPSMLMLHWLSGLTASLPGLRLIGLRRTPPASDTHTLTLQEHEVRRVPRSVNPRKTAGPDGVKGEVLQSSADWLTGLSTRISNISLSRATIPSCLKSVSIIPVPKKARF